MLSTLSVDNEPLQRSRANSIRANARATACRTHAAVSCLAASCDWSEECWAGVLHAANTVSSCLDCRLDSLDTLSIRRYGLIDFNTLFGNAKIVQS